MTFTPTDKTSATPQRKPRHHHTDTSSIKKTTAPRHGKKRRATLPPPTTTRRGVSTPHRKEQRIVEAPAAPEEKVAHKTSITTHKHPGELYHDNLLTNRHSHKKLQVGGGDLDDTTCFFALNSVVSPHTTLTSKPTLMTHLSSFWMLLILFHPNYRGARA